MSEKGITILQLRLKDYELGFQAVKALVALATMSLLVSLATAKAGGIALLAGWCALAVAAFLGLIAIVPAQRLFEHEIALAQQDIAETPAQIAARAAHENRAGLLVGLSIVFFFAGLIFLIVATYMTLDA